MSEHVFKTLLKAYQEGLLSPEKIRLETEVKPPLPEDILNPAELSQNQTLTLKEIGEKAVQNGEVAALVLSGGMATRFNFDAPKGLFPIIDEITFLELKIRALCGHGIPLYLMTSFHTHDAIIDYLEQHNWFGHREHVHVFQQFKLPRIYPNGSIRMLNGEVDYATAGHGDFVEALRQSGLLQDFLTQGGKYLLFSNIDNLGATYDPVLLGLHINNDVEMSIEVAAKEQRDRGGAPARVENRLQLVEEFLFPEHFDQDTIKVFNTASYTFSAAALNQSFELPWYIVRKTVNGEAVLQFEHLAGDLSAALSIQCLLIDRAARFLPVKNQSDVPMVQALIRKKYADLI